VRKVRESDPHETPTCCTSESSRTTGPLGRTCSRTSRTVVVDEAAHLSRCLRLRHVALVLRRFAAASARSTGSAPQFLLARRDDRQSRPRPAPAPHRPRRARRSTPNGAPRAGAPVSRSGTTARLLDGGRRARGGSGGSGRGPAGLPWAALTARGAAHGSASSKEPQGQQELVYRFRRGESLESAGRATRRRRPTALAPPIFARGVTRPRSAGRIRGRPDLRAPPSAWSQTEALELGVDVGPFLGLPRRSRSASPGTVAKPCAAVGAAPAPRPEGPSRCLLSPARDDRFDRYFINHPDMPWLGRPNRGRHPRSHRTPRIRHRPPAAAAGLRALRSAVRARRLTIVLGERRAAGGRRAARRGRRARAPRPAGPRLARRPDRRPRHGLAALGSPDAIAVVEAATGAMRAFSAMLEQERAFANGARGCGLPPTAARTYHARQRSIWGGPRRASVSALRTGPWYTAGPRPAEPRRAIRAGADRPPSCCCGVELAYGGRRGERPGGTPTSAGACPKGGGRLDTNPASTSRRGSFSTRALWFVPPDELMEEVGGDLLGALARGRARADLRCCRCYAMCATSWDIGGLSTNIHPADRLRPTVFVYDGHDTGGGPVPATSRRPSRRARRGPCSIRRGGRRGAA